MPDGSWGSDGHVIVCGLHGVGLRTVEQLHRSGVRVVVVDDGSEHPEALAEVCARHGATLIRRAVNGGPGAERILKSLEPDTRVILRIDSGTLPTLNTSSVRNLGSRHTVPN